MCWVCRSRPGDRIWAFPGAWLRLGDRQLHLLELPNVDPVDARPEHGGRDRHTAVTVSDSDGFAARLRDAGVDYTVSRSGRRALFVATLTATPGELIEA